MSLGCRSADFVDVCMIGDFLNKGILFVAQRHCAIGVECLANSDRCVDVYVRKNDEGAPKVV